MHNVHIHAAHERGKNNGDVQVVRITTANGQKLSMNALEAITSIFENHSSLFVNEKISETPGRYDFCRL